MAEKILVQGLVKIFGDHPEKAIPLLHKGYGKEEILSKTGQAIGVNNISFVVEKGEVFVLMGLSGSGKSTVLRCINRLIELTSGKVIIDDEDVTAAGETRLREIRRKKLSMVFQGFALFPHRTVLDNVAYGLEIQGIDKEKRYNKAREVIEMVGLCEWEMYLPEHLSGGMQQRVGLARALASDPDILLMDEAFSALDPLIRREMQNELLALQSKVKKTIVFVTHDLDEALKIGDRIALMKDGDIVQVDTPEQILTRPADEYVQKFVEDVDMSKVLVTDGIMKKAEAISLKDGPRVALRRMQEMGISSIFVVDRERKLAGLVTAEDALQASDKNDVDLSMIIRHDFPTAAPAMPLNELIPLLAEAKFPLAVVDEQERLLGIVVRGTLLAALVRKGGG